MASTAIVIMEARPGSTGKLVGKAAVESVTELVRG
jgi:hypothetical protein